MEAIAQSELMSELGVPIPERKAVRDRLLGPDDWFKKGRQIMIRPAGETKLRVWKEEPSLVAEIKSFSVCQIPANPRYVMIDVGGRACPCVIPSRLKPTFGRGKKIRVQCVTDEKGTSYRHESIS
jgi:hypothetical protein